MGGRKIWEYGGLIRVGGGGQIEEKVCLICSKKMIDTWEAILWKGALSIQLRQQ